MSVDLDAVADCARHLENVIAGIDETDPTHCDSRLYQELTEHAREALDLLYALLETTPVTTKGD